jgi:[acyl-carrier-protein] S-malonyltransferase
MARLRPDFGGQGIMDEYLEKANQILGFDLKKIILEGPEEELKKTAIQQPAIFVVSAAMFNQLTTYNLQLTTVAGHSLGEYSALYAAGALSFEDGVKLVHLRGKFMQEAVPIGVGAMAAVLSDNRDLIKNICQEVGNVWPANFNAPGQIVISGEKQAVEAASAKLKEAGVRKIIPLAVSAPFHCPLMQPAADKLKVELDKIRINDAKIPVVANVTADYVTAADQIKEILVKQVTGSVLWEDSVKRMIADGVNQFIEVGPGKVLSGLIKKIDPDVEVKTYDEA